MTIVNRWQRKAALLFTFLVLLLVIAVYFGRPLWGRFLHEDAAITAAEIESRASTEVLAFVDACEADVRIGSLRELEDRIVLRIERTVVPDHDDCLHSVLVQLSRELGDRKIVDGTTGSVVSTEVMGS